MTLRMALLFIAATGALLFGIFLYKYKTVERSTNAIYDKFGIIGMLLVLAPFLAYMATLNPAWGVKTNLLFAVWLITAYELLRALYMRFGAPYITNIRKGRKTSEKETHDEL